MTAGPALARSGPPGLLRDGRPARILQRPIERGSRQTVKTAGDRLVIRGGLHPQDGVQVLVRIARRRPVGLGAAAPAPHPNTTDAARAPASIRTDMPAILAPDYGLPAGSEAPVAAGRTPATGAPVAAGQPLSPSGAARRAPSRVTVNYATITVNAVTEAAVENPFVYGEVVPAGASCGSRGRARRAWPPTWLAGQKVFLISPRRYGKSSLIRQRAGRRRRAPRRAHRRGHRQQLQLVRRVSRRATRARVAAETQLGSRADAGCARRSAPRGRRSAYAPTPTPLGALTVVVSRRALRARRRRASRRRSSRCRPGSPTPAAARSSSRSTSSRRSAGSTADRSSTRCARAVQHQREVGYVFAGSEPTPDGARCSARSGRSTRPGPVMRLREDSCRRVRRVHRRSVSRDPGMRVDAGLRARDRSIWPGNLPYDVQRLGARNLGRCARWRVAGARRSTICIATLRRLLAEQRDVLRGDVAAADAGAARSSSRASCSRTASSLLSADVRARHRLGGAVVGAGGARRPRSDDVVSARAATAGSSSIR